MANEVLVVVYSLLKEENHQKVGKKESSEHICKQGNQRVAHQNQKESNPASSASTALLIILVLHFLSQHSFLAREKNKEK